MKIYEKIPVIVTAEFIGRPKKIITVMGIQTVSVGQWLITRLTGEQWAMSQDDFKARYESTGEDHLYRSKPSRVEAKQLTSTETIARGDYPKGMIGKPGDWRVRSLVDGSEYFAQDEIFRATYRQIK